MSDLRPIKEQPGETLQKYIQRFNNARLKIPKVTDGPSSQHSLMAFVTSR